MASNAFGSFTAGSVGLGRAACARTAFSGAVGRVTEALSGAPLSGLVASLAFLVREEWSADLRACGSVAGFDFPAGAAPACDAVPAGDVVGCEAVGCDASPTLCAAPDASSAHTGAIGSHSARHPAASITQTALDHPVINRTLARSAARGRKMNKLVQMFH